MGGGRVLTVDEQTKDMARLKLKARKKKDIVRPAGAAHSKDIHMAGSKDMARTKDTPTMKDTARSKDMAGSKDTVGSKDNNMAGSKHTPPTPSWTMAALPSASARMRACESHGKILHLRRLPHHITIAAL